MPGYRGGGATKVYVGNLPRDCEEREVEKAFEPFGKVRSVWVARNPPGFAFVEYEDTRDADDACKDMDGAHVAGSRVRVELSHGRQKPKAWMGGGGGGGGRGDRYGDRGGGGPPRSRRQFDPDDRCYECGDRGHYAYDCKNKKGGGGGGGRSRRSYSRSRSRDRSRSRSRSPRRSHSRSRSRSRGQRKQSRSASPKQRSASRSRSRSQKRSASRSRSRSQKRSQSRT